MGGGAYDIYRLSCEFAQIDLGLATSMLAVALGTDPIRVGCTRAQKRRVAPAHRRRRAHRRVRGDGAGSRLERAERADAGTADHRRRRTVTHYSLTGVKQFISNGSIADLYTVLAKAPDGPSFFIVERGTPGLTPGKHEVKHGIRLSDTAQVLVRRGRRSRRSAHRREGRGGAEAGERGLRLHAPHGRRFRARRRHRVAERRPSPTRSSAAQMGTLLCEKQGYTHKLLVPNSVRLAAARAYIEHVADLLDSGNKDRQVEGAIAKIFATEAGNIAADDAVQALGGYGYCVEFEVEKIRRDARILRIYEGTSEILQNIVGLYRMRESVRSKGRSTARWPIRSSRSRTRAAPPLANDGALPLDGARPSLPREAQPPAARAVRVRDVDRGAGDGRRTGPRRRDLGRRAARGAVTGLRERCGAVGADAAAEIVQRRRSCRAAGDLAGSRSRCRRAGSPIWTSSRGRSRATRVSRYEIQPS